MNSLIAAHTAPAHYPFRGTGALMNVAVTPRGVMPRVTCTPDQHCGV